MKRALTIAIVAGVIAAGGGVAVLAQRMAAPARASVSVAQPAAAEIKRPAFTEIKWPFLMDQWGLGRAFRCDAAVCGAKVEVYVRPKIGFCNCTTGVADDEELERVGDMELIGEQFKASSDGHPIAVAWMKGRSRPYDVAGRASGSTLALAFNDHCDVIVATAVVTDGPAARVEPAVLAFLNSDTVVNWAKQALGL
ncbi:MAG TPA: hypothetical protein VKX28_18070 [Xanthobacteraceae bacterium]|nr:hypothetical protein [Xanthobacteraceae bacterium]